MMLKITFEINGRTVDPENLENVFEQAVLQEIDDQIRSKVENIRDPETGEFPIVTIRGKDLDHLSLQVSGSEKILGVVKERLGLEDSEEVAVTEENPQKRTTPCVFLCHASEDKAMATRLAEDFHGNGINTFFDKWEIEAGDSIRQKIDAGLEKCTHFVVLLTAVSVQKPWVKSEMDAGFVRKVSGQCRFVALRSGLAADALPPLLAGLYSPPLEDYETDVRKLINSIHGLTEKPPLGPPPNVIAESSSTQTRLSPVADKIARRMVEQSQNGDLMDPAIGTDELRSMGFSDEEIIDAVDELKGHSYVQTIDTLMSAPFGYVSIGAEPALFIELDRFFKDWNPETDALRIAADLVNGATNGHVQSVADRYSWTPRRMNPAVRYLIEHHLVDSSAELGSHPWCRSWIGKSSSTRRFVRNRS